MTTASKMMMIMMSMLVMMMRKKFMTRKKWKMKMSLGKIIMMTRMMMERAFGASFGLRSVPSLILPPVATLTTPSPPPPTALFQSSSTRFYSSDELFCHFI